MLHARRVDVHDASLEIEDLHAIRTVLDEVTAERLELRFRTVTRGRSLSPRPERSPPPRSAMLAAVMAIHIREAVRGDAASIAAIYNQGMEDRVATFETQPRTATDILVRLGEAERFPILVAIDGDQVLGWAGLSSYRPRACYAGIAEFSIYFDRAARGRGLGRQLLTALIDAARGRGYWKLVSRVF